MTMPKVCKICKKRPEDDLILVRITYWAPENRTTKYVYRWICSKCLQYIKEEP